MVPGKGEADPYTGQLGDVMQESIRGGAAPWCGAGAQATRAIDADFYQEQRLPHPCSRKGRRRRTDPSAGVGMCTALVSALSGVSRCSASVAMTGEITLRGAVLPIGGLKEKLLAALRGGIEISADSGRERAGTDRDPRGTSSRTWRSVPVTLDRRGAGSRPGATCRNA